MEVLNITIDMFKSYILVLVRVSVVLFMFPLFQAKRVPANIKAGLAFALSFALLPMVKPDPGLFPEHIWGFVILVISELILGFMLGLVVDCFFVGIQMAGQMAGVQMGFAIATVMDPNSGIQSSLVSQLGYWTALMVFLMLDGHMMVINALKESFFIIKPGYLSLQKGLYKPVIELSKDVFVLAVKIGAPAIAALLFTDTAFALTAKVAPQMNVFIVALPLKIAVGLFFFGVTLNLILYIMNNYLKTFMPMMKNLMRLMT